MHCNATTRAGRLPRVQRAPSTACSLVIERRTFLGMVATGLLAAPLAAEAQQPGKVYRIGWLRTTAAPSPPLQRQAEAFLQGLRDHGFVEGQNLAIERR